VSINDLIEIRQNAEDVLIKLVDERLADLAVLVTTGASTSSAI
jgi:hypothetical protein